MRILSFDLSRDPRKFSDSMTPSPKAIQWWKPVIEVHLHPLRWDDAAVEGGICILRLYRDPGNELWEYVPMEIAG